MNIKMNDLMVIIRDEILNVLSDYSGFIVESKKKKKRSKGSPWRDSNGRFSTKKDARVWTDGYANSNRSDCTGGKWRTDWTGKKFISKHPCGRRDDGGKHPWKCKDSTRAYQEGMIEEDYVLGPSGEIMKPDLRNVSEGDLIEEINRRIDEGTMSNDQILALCSKISQASKGNFPPTK